MKVTVYSLCIILPVYGNSN